MKFYTQEVERQLFVPVVIFKSEKPALCVKKKMAALVAIYDENALTICPFDLGHGDVNKEHITQCRQRILDGPFSLKKLRVENMMKCSFNENHYLPECLIDLHSKLCTSRKQPLTEITVKLDEVEKSFMLWHHRLEKKYDEVMEKMQIKRSFPDSQGIDLTQKSTNKKMKKDLDVDDDDDGDQDHENKDETDSDAHDADTEEVDSHLQEWPSAQPLDFFNVAHLSPTAMVNQLDDIEREGSIEQSEKSEAKSMDQIEK